MGEKINESMLTKLLAYDGGPAQHHVPDEEVKMAEDDERRRGSRAAVVLLDQLVSLKLPNPVRVVLNGLERKAVQKHNESPRVTRAHRGRGNAQMMTGVRLKDVMGNLLEDGYEQVEQQYVGKEQVNTEHGDGEPLGEGWRLVFIQHRTLGLQRIAASQAAGVQVKRSICTGRRSLPRRNIVIKQPGLCLVRVTTYLAIFHLTKLQSFDDTHNQYLWENSQI